MLDGTEIHALVEFWLKFELSPPDTRNGDAARALVKYLPPPGTINESLIEARFRVAPNLLKFPKWLRSIIDLITVDADCLVVQDHKTRSKLKWALTAAELKTDFQIKLYALVAARAVKWSGSVKVQHNNVTRSKPHNVRIVSTILTPQDLARFEVHARQTFGAMLFAGGLPIEKVEYNVTACDDYKSRMNPDGCEHRHRCLAIGRKVGGELSFYLQRGANMTNPMADILARSTGMPQPTGPMDDKIKALDPDIQYGENENKPGLLLKLQAEQTRLIIELKTLGCGHEDAHLRALSIPRLQGLQAQYKTPRDATSMTAAECIAEICQIRPDLTVEMCADMAIGDLQGALVQLRAEASIDVGQIDPPDKAPDTTPPDLAAQVEGTAPADPTKVKADPSRGLKLPEAYGGGLIGSEAKSSGELQRYIADNGHECPKRLGDMKKLAKSIMLGTAVGLYSGSVAPTPKAAAPETDRTRALARLAGLMADLSMPFNDAAADAMPDRDVLEMINKCEIVKAKAAIALPEHEDRHHAASWVLLVNCNTSDRYTDIATHEDLISYTDPNAMWGAVVEFGRRVREGDTVLAGNCYVSTRTPLGGYLAEVLRPLADGRVIRGDR